MRAAPLLVLLLAHQYLGQDVPGIEVHRAALAAHAQAEGRLEEQERREQGLKEEVPGIQAHRAALAAHAQAEGRLEKVEPKEDKASSPKPIQESVKKVNKIAATDKAAFKDILKAAVGKLLKNFGNKNTTGGALDKKGSGSYLDGLLTQLKSGKKVLSREKEESSSLDELVRQLERRERGKDRAALATPILIASPESFLEKLLSKQARNRKRPSSRRSNQRSRLDHLLASIHGNDYDYDFNFDDDIGFLESPRHRDYFEDDFSFPRGSSSLKSALRSSRRLEGDLEYLLRKLERERN
jgi:hypothetical protein